ncbi:hypothetical protein GGI22_004459, partial [Coemansia erecta]
MAELVTYEDSPLAQYLQEIDATEDTITEKYPYEARRKSGITELAKACDAETDIPWNARINIAKLLTWILGPSEKASLSRIAETVWDFVANTLALSGHLAERYTPKPAPRSRALDITIQKAMRFIQEVVFVSKGFRVPQYAGAGTIASRPGRGTLWAAGYLQQTVVDALVLCIQALFDTLDALIVSTEQRAAGDLVQPCDSATVSGLKSEFALLNEGNADGINPMEQLH